ncbi:MAG: damage-control phosphatase ARMT1 family protein [Dehalococcoidia bacterium]
MKLAPDCYDCLRKLIYQAAELATCDASLRQRAIAKAVRILDNEFSHDQLSIVIATRIHKVIRELTHNPDPYRSIKRKEMTLAKEVCAELSLPIKQSSPCEDEFDVHLRLAAAANAVDFFKDPSCIKEEVRKPVTFAIDHSKRFAAKLSDANKVLYLADNAGELYFDLPLVKWLKQFAQVIYVVKPSPVQDDATLEDIREAGLENEFGRIMTTGVASPGIVFSLTSAEFQREFDSADIIFAKGMGHYEALSELPTRGRFFYCLKAKCQPVADSLGVPVTSYVAMLQ